MFLDWADFLGEEVLLFLPSLAFLVTAMMTKMVLKRIQGWVVGWLAGSMEGWMDQPGWSCCFKLLSQGWDQQQDEVGQE